MNTTLMAASISLAATFAFLAPAQAQGVVKGAQEGAAVGNKAAGPVGGAVGGAVGGVTGGVVGGVKGVLGVPQNTSTSSSRARRVSATSDLSQSSLKADLLGRPLAWANSDNTQTATVVFYTDGTAVMSDGNLPSGADDKGTWTFKGKRLCVTWEKLRPGQETCSTWTRTGQKAYRDSDGMVVTTR
jgi:hypothetical protein